MTDSAENKPNIVIYDTVTGRVQGGHQADYLAALEKAFSNFPVETYAPFRNRPSATSSFAGRVCASVMSFRRMLNSKRPTLVLIPNPASLDFVTFALAALLKSSSGQGNGVFVMRRDAAGIAGPGWRAVVLDWIVCGLARRSDFNMVSDTRMAIDHWKARTGRDGVIVSIPMRNLVKKRDPGAHLVLGLIGLFRIEKGCAYYDIMIETTRTHAPHLRIVCQLSNTGKNPEEAVLARGLAAKWRDDPMIRLQTEHLDDADYTEMLHELDVVALPYDVKSYGPGTSGVLFESLAAGKIVLAAPIAWALQEYNNHPNIVWLDGMDPISIKTGLERALKAASHRGTIPDTSHPDTFRQSWLDAIAHIHGGASHGQH